MCRLLAALPASKSRQGELIVQLSNLARCGVVPQGEPEGHSDNWGLCSYSNQQLRHYITMTESADGSKQLEKISGELKQYPQELVIGHVRKASIGDSSVLNAHPFIYNQYSFAHNGTIFDISKDILSEECQKIVTGETDSEIFFARIMQYVGEGNTTKNALLKTIKYIDKTFDYTALNCLLADGKTLYAIRHYNPKNTYVKTLAMAEYYTLFVGYEKEIPVVICSEAIPDAPYIWKPLGNNEMFTYELESNIWDINQSI
ncbi:MAG: class II glutamine amidotransferase [Patescibacteria group bacterium]